MTSRTFLFGPLCDEALRRIVLGAEVPAVAAVLADHSARAVGEGAVLVEEPGARTEGLVIGGHGALARERLSLWQAAEGNRSSELVLEDGVAATVWRPETQGARGAEWDFARWQTEWGDAVREAAREIMEYFGRQTPEWVGARRGQILQRAASAARAARHPAPAELRSRGGEGDVDVRRHRRPYSDYFTLVEQDLRFRRFDGTWSAPVTRAGLVGGDAVTVLPYDPLRDEVMLVEQFRFGPWSRGDPRPWTLEPVAGRVDPGEMPEETAFRETLEEAKLPLDRLERVGSCYASPGCFSEYVFSYVGICDLGGRGGVVAGSEEEDEDILCHVVPFARLMELVDTGEVENAPLLLTVWWLVAHHDRLRGKGAQG